MKRMTAAQIRNAYLTFFEERGHTIVPSSSMVVADDPTLLFANSGMVQFKDTFLGLEQRPYKRATTSQKCLRVSGKHNDLEEVGPSPRHHTFFEMLGNFSFGDYFKPDAIKFAWELLTEIYELPVDRLWFSVFEGNEHVPADEEAVQLWQEVGADPSRILRFSAKDNFWEMGPTGPCGPNSEIHFYQGDDPDNQVASGVNSDDDYMEIWNLVFMQYNRDAQGVLAPLPRPSIDTGLGFERVVALTQGVRNNYDTDLFLPTIHRTIDLADTDEAHYQAHVAPYRAIADHSRATAFLIADGVLPGNNGRSYVLRRVLRRAVYQGRTIGIERPFMAQTVATVIDGMSDAYPELRQRRDFILETTDAEERQFLRTIDSGIGKLHAVIEQVKSRGATEIPGDEAFRLKDTDGFPLDLTERIAAEQGFTVDETGFQQAMTEQRERSRAAAQFKRGADADTWADHELPATEFTGYTTLQSTGTVLALVAHADDVSTAQAGQQVQIVLDRTPFYAESGGQVGDSGLVVGAGGTVQIDDTQRPVPGLVVHYGRVVSGQIARGDQVTAQVDAQRRGDIQRNHTATHMLQRALRDVVGDHAAQAGSLVAPERLRFDFTHIRAVEPAQLREIEQRLNAWIRTDVRVSWDVTDYQTALDRGAIALFGEKYGDQVRVVHIERQGDVPANGAGVPTQTEGTVSPDISLDVAVPAFASRDSIELCGGTHISHTGEIGYVRIVNEGSVGSGIRRIEALTGRGAEAWADEQAATLRELAARLGVAPAQIAERIDSLLSETKQRQGELDTLRGQLTRGTLEGLLDQVQRNNGLSVLAAQVDANDAAHLRQMGDWLRDKLGSGVIVLGTVIDDKPQLLSVVTPDLVQQGYHAGNLVKALAQLVGGGGGGRPDMAQAGGRDADKLPDALDQVAQLAETVRKK